MRQVLLYGFFYLHNNCNQYDMLIEKAENTFLYGFHNVWLSHTTSFETIVLLLSLDNLFIFFFQKSKLQEW